MIVDFFIELKKLGFVKTKQEFYGVDLTVFEEILCVFLFQNTKWDNVLKSIRNIQTSDISEKNILDCDLATLIKPSGFYNTKAKRIKDFFKVVFNTYPNDDKAKSLNCFLENISRDFLLDIKGVSEHCADSILCFIKHEDILVVDGNFKLIAKYLGYEFDTYDELKDIFQSAIFSDLEKLFEVYQAASINELLTMIYFACFEFCKVGYKNKEFTTISKEILDKAL